MEECLQRVNQLQFQDSHEPFSLLHWRLKSHIFSFIIVVGNGDEQQLLLDGKSFLNLSLVCREWNQLLKDLRSSGNIPFDISTTTIIGNQFDGFSIIPLKKIKKRFILIGNDENRRVGYFQAALSSFGLPPAKTITWEKIVSTGVVNPLNHQINVVDNNTIAPIDWNGIIDSIKKEYLINYGEEFNIEDVVIRFDSPGENFFVERGLFSLGCQPMLNEHYGTRVSEYDINNTLTFDLGQVRYIRQWYLGFVNAMDQIGQALGRLGIKPTQYMSSIDGIATTFDKRLCHNLLSKHEIPLPKAFYNIRTYDELHQILKENNMERVFIKPAHGSSASGVIAYCFMEQKRGDTVMFKELATTSAELIRDRNFPQYFKIYNSLRIKRYTKNDDIRELINFICSEGAIVEEWLEKADYMGRGNFDLRIIVIGGKIMNFVVRTSKNPMTNLHLGNKRGECEDFLRLVEYKAPGSWDRVKETCHRIGTECLPSCLCLGVDLMFSEDFKQHYILEVNGFGDLSKFYL